MKKLLLTIMIATLSLFGESIMIDDFQTDIFSKNSNSLRKIKLSLVFDTNETVPKYKIKDGLNIVISSFYLEDLFTSKTKEEFKKLLIDYLKKKNSVEVSAIYINDMQIVEQVSVKEILDEIDKMKDKKGKI